MGKKQRKQEKLTRSYDGAAGGRRWRGQPDMPNTISAMHAARGPIGRRARYIAANVPLAASAAEAWVSALVGTGIKPSSGHADDATRAALNARFESWTDDADADNLTDYYGLQALMVRRMVIDGEAFALLVNDDDGVKLRLIDSEQIDATLNRQFAGGTVVQGVEFDNAGKRVAYWILPQIPGLPFAQVAPAQRVAAQDVIHLFRPETPGQVRGISWFAPVLLRLNDLDSTRDAQVIRQRTGAMLAGFVTSSADGRPNDGERVGDTLIGGLQPGTLQYLDPGQSVTFSDPPAIGVDAIQFMKLTEREIAAGLGLPASVLTGDLSDVNYSSIRAGLVEWRRRIDALQHSVLAFQMLRPTWRRWAATEVLSGRIATTVDAALPVKFITPKTAWVDPLKDVQAEIIAINAGLMSRREAVTARGVDVEVLDAEIAADKERADSLGLTFGAPTAANDNQPAASDAA